MVLLKIRQTQFLHSQPLLLAWTKLIAALIWNADIAKVLRIKLSKNTALRIGHSEGGHQRLYHQRNQEILS